MAIRPLIEYLGINTTQENISQLYDCMTYQPSYHQLLNPSIKTKYNQYTADQPIFSLTKELKIRFPDKFGPDKYFCLFGSLHIENSLLIICGQVIKGSGLDEIMCICGLSIVGADSLATVNDIKKARYYLQVGAGVIYLKLKQVHMDSRSYELILS